MARRPRLRVRNPAVGDAPLCVARHAAVARRGRARGDHGHGRRAALPGGGRDSAARPPRPLGGARGADPARVPPGARGRLRGAAAPPRLARARPRGGRAGAPGRPGLPRAPRRSGGAHAPADPMSRAGVVRRVSPHHPADRAQAARVGRLRRFQPGRDAGRLRGQRDRQPPRARGPLHPRAAAQPAPARRGRRPALRARRGRGGALLLALARQAARPLRHLPRRLRLSRRGAILAGRLRRGRRRVSRPGLCPRPAAPAAGAARPGAGRAPTGTPDSPRWGAPSSWSSPPTCRASTAPSPAGACPWTVRR